MSKSIMPKDIPECCWICGRAGDTDVHHIFGGANRKWSEKYGLTVHLCRNCHRKVHDYVDGLMSGLHKAGEQVYIDQYFEGDTEAGIESFRKVFGKNYL